VRFSRTRLSDIVHRLASVVRGPGLTRSVAAGDPVDESVEPMLAILLSAAVKHATESMNLVHTQGAADGSSRYGTHQGPSLVSRASMKYGPFPHRRLCCPQRLKQYYDPLRLPLDHPRPLPGFAGYRPGIASLAPQATGPRRLSRVPKTTIRTFNAQYAGGFLSARSWNKNAFHGLRRGLTGSAPS